MSNDKVTSPSNALLYRVLMALFFPPLAAVVAAYFISNYTNVADASNQGISAVLLGTMAIVSWLMGLRWYGIQGLGLRGGRPLTAGIGFAALGWIFFLILRFVFVEAAIDYPENSTRTFIYLLLFEAFASQLWAFGLVFKAIADWRGPLTAVIASGILFGLAGILFFQENFSGGILSTIYFVFWGVLYGFIRLRSGSILGSVIVQAVQSFTSWIVIAPNFPVNAGQLQNLYMTASIAYIVIIWRLWPRRSKDYRV